MAGHLTLGAQATPSQAVQPGSFPGAGRAARAVDLLQIGRRPWRGEDRRDKPGQFRDRSDSSHRPKATSGAGRRCRWRRAEAGGARQSGGHALQSYVREAFAEGRVSVAKALGDARRPRISTPTVAFRSHAAQAYLGGGRYRKALEHLCRVPESDPQLPRRAREQIEDLQLLRRAAGRPHVTGLRSARSGNRDVSIGGDADRHRRATGNCGSLPGKRGNSRAPSRYQPASR